jgi:GT2 family glycosyltransferase
VLNNDLLLPDGWAERLLDCDRHVICPSYEQSQRSRGDFQEHNEKLRAKLSDVREADRPGKHPTGFSGFCFILSREAYERTGPFDEEYRYWYGDNDYYLRLLNMGFEPAMSYNVLIHHYTNKTCADMPDFKTQREAERRIFLKRWPDGVALRENERV